MKGIVFTEFLEMVENQFGVDTVDYILDVSELPSGGAYTAVGSYDHKEIVSLVQSLSEKTKVEVPALLRAYGEYLFGRFSELYPQFFNNSQGAFAFLESIEGTIHVEVKKLYPTAELPHFRYEKPDEKTLIMVYESSRHFEDLAEGLILGCAKHFQEDLTIEREPTEEDATRFRLTRE